MEHISRREHERANSPAAPYEAGLREVFKVAAIPEKMEELLRRLQKAEELKH